MTENERIKELRKSRGLTLEQFGERVGVSRSAMSNIELGNRAVTDQMRRSICREFGVREAWLRTGEGEAFVSAPLLLEEELRAFFDAEHSAFTERLIRLLLRLPREHWDLLAQYARELVAENQSAPPDVPDEADDLARRIREDMGTGGGSSASSSAAGSATTA